MKRLIILLAAAMLLLLAGCSKAVGGSYRLEYITSDGVRLPPSNLGMNISFELSEDGIGTAVYGSTPMDITWVEEGSEVVVTSPYAELRFSRDGDNLILHDNGTLLFFTPVEEEEDDKKN